MKFKYTDHILTTLLGLSILSCIQSDKRTEEEAQPPNIIVILADDLGYSDIGSYGSEIPTPNIDQLATGGVRFSQFYNTARCCPTRASLLTGLYQHQAGMGLMTGSAKQQPDNPAYQGFLNQSCQTIAEVLKPAGYHTYMAGKWHVGSSSESMWPLQRGFERYYGIIGGASSYFSPKGLMLDNEELPRPEDPDYYTTDKFTDYAIQFMNDQTDENPFFLYLAYNAPHWPLNAKAEDIERFVGKYTTGWDQLREERWMRQLEMGLLEEEWGLSPRTEEVRAWDALSEQDQKDLDYRMAVYAAMVYRIDVNVGRIFEHLKSTNQLDNTLIVFLSDNGGCPEPWGGLEYRGYSDLGGGMMSMINDRNAGGGGGRDGKNGSSYGEGWANASNTPFRLYKTQSHEGGISTPFIAHWPKGIQTESGSITHSPGHIIDLMPTFVELSGAEYPVQNGENIIVPMQGKSLTPIFENGTREPHEWLFWEHSREAAARNGDFKAIFHQPTNSWTLYNIKQDRNELNDLSEEMPEKLEAMKTQWFEWAEDSGVLPKRGITEEHLNE